MLGCRSSQARSTRGWFREDGREKQAILQSGLLNVSLCYSVGKCSLSSEWVDEWKKRRPRGGADAKWNYPTLDRVSGIVGISMQNRKSIKNKHKNKKTKEGVNSVVLLGKEEEEKKKKEMKEENEGKNESGGEIWLCFVGSLPVVLIMRTVLTVNILDFIWRDSSPFNLHHQPYKHIAS